MRACVRQPIGIPRLNTADDLSRGLITSLFDNGDGARVIHGTPFVMTPSASLASASSMDATAKKVSSAGYQQGTHPTNGLSQTINFSVVFGVAGLVGTNFTSEQHILSRFQTGRSNGFAAYLSSGSLMFGSNDTQYSCGSLTFGRLDVVQADFNDTNITGVYLNGVLQRGSFGSVPGAASASIVTIGADASGSGLLTTGSVIVPFIHFYSRLLSSAERARFASRPWSLFTEKSWLYTGMGSGSWTPLEVAG